MHQDETPRKVMALATPAANRSAGQAEGQSGAITAVSNTVATRPVLVIRAGCQTA